MTTAGLVIAGGMATRFGSEKALASSGGLPLIARVVEALAADCAVVGVNARPGTGTAGWAEASGLELVTDRADHAAGPLAGVHAGLEWARARGMEALATAPCDVPGIPGGFVARLLEELTPDSLATAVMTRRGLQPLCAIWRVEALAILGPMLSGGAHPPVRRMLAALNYKMAAFEDEAAFRNINTVEDLERGSS